ncbi:betaine--homocysteine S-methyltransferase [Thioclava sp. GXIMD4215]|uniref:betaine--homocysteine S-methyltransferase n=1 Tax=Thioclava sp. GXIMD4215 TaxID=3131928 RepID=UPI00324FAF04
MTKRLQQLLAENDTLLADAATGTTLFNMGLPAGHPAELWSVEHPEHVTALHREALENGAQILCTNSYGGNRCQLERFGRGAQAPLLATAAARLARKIADQAPDPVIVAGSIGPTGEIFAPMGTMTRQRAVEIYTEQARALREGGVDLLWFETLSSLEEVHVAEIVARDCAMEWCISMNFDTAGRSMMGVSPTEFTRKLDKLAYKPVAAGANCGMGASDLLRSILEMAASGTDIPLIAKSNAGVPHFHHGELHYTGTPELMAEYALMARDCGARIIGGCCGTQGAHLAAMRDALARTPKSSRPTLDQIAQALGRFSNGA